MSATMEADLDEITAEELVAIRRIRAKAAANRKTDYRKALEARLAKPRQFRASPDAAEFRLPNGTPGDPQSGYQTYRLIAGKHERYDKRDLAEARRLTQEDRKERGPGVDTTSPEKHVFIPGQLVTPESDAEALMIDQDPGKFRLHSADAPQDGSQSVEELLAEVNRLRMGQATPDEIAARQGGNKGQGGNKQGK